MKDLFLIFIILAAQNTQSIRMHSYDEDDAALIKTYIDLETDEETTKIPSQAGAQANDNDHRLVKDDYGSDLLDYESYNKVVKASRAQLRRENPAPEIAEPLKLTAVYSGNDKDG